MILKQNNPEGTYPEPNQLSSSGKYWPNSNAMRCNLAMPLTLIATPFSSSVFDEGTISRCCSCKAFINVYCKIVSQNEYECSICGCTNHTHEKLNKDCGSLQQLSYECNAPQSIKLMVNQNTKPLLVFVLDLSSNDNFNQNFLIYSIYLLRSFLQEKIKNIQKGQSEDINVLIITFDDYVHEYQFQDNQIIKIINSQIELFTTQIPNLHKYIVSLTKKYKQIIQLLIQIETQVKEIKINPIHQLEHSSKAIVKAIFHSLNISKGYSGKLYLYSSINSPLKQFKLIPFELQDRLTININKSNCLPKQLISLAEKTQISLSIFIMNNQYINLLPFQILAKMTNGELRHFAKNQPLRYFYQLRYQLHGQFDQLRRQTILRVRYSSGLKLINVFGNYRTTKFADQIQLVSCPINRNYLLEFIIEGKIIQPSVTIQLSLLSIFKDKRIFKVITYRNAITENINTLIGQINYPNISVSYVRAVIHNLDSQSQFKHCRASIQERCRKHFKALLNYNQEENQQSKKNNNILSTLGHLSQESENTLPRQQINQQMIESVKKVSYFKNAQNYALSTYYLIKSPLLNAIYKPDLFLDKLFVKRNQIETFPNPMNFIWPLAYIIFQSHIDLIQLNDKYLQLEKLGILIDEGDHCKLYLTDQELKNQLLKVDQHEVIERLKSIDEFQKYKILTEFLIKMQQDNETGYLIVCIRENINEIQRIDNFANCNYKHFINKITKD